MMLGVLLHAANVYAEPQTWLVGDPPGRRSFALLSAGIHVFRIPAFFVVAGFFAGLSLERYGPGEFLRRRCVRLVVPLASAALVLGTLQGWLLYRHGTPGYGPSGGGELSLAGYVGSPHCARMFGEGLWVTHLWFLVNLIVYVLATTLIAALPGVGRRLARAADVVEESAGRRAGRAVRRGLFVLLLPFVSLSALAVAAVVPGAYGRVLGVVSLHTLLDYAPYYVFGIFAYRARAFFEGLLAPGVWIVPAVAVAAALAASVSGGPDDLSRRAAGAYLDSLLIWLSIAAVLAAFRLALSRRSRAFAYLSEASYTVYLFHHVCVIALALALAGPGGPEVGPWTKFAFVVAVTLVVTLALHHFVILRVPPLRFAFNGKWR